MSTAWPFCWFDLQRFCSDLLGIVWAALNWRYLVRFNRLVKMGSLMAGWDSPVMDSKKVVFERNKSLTREEIENYWRFKRKSEEEHLMAVAEAAPNLNRVSESGGGDMGERQQNKPQPRLEISRTFPGARTQYMDDEEALRNMNGCWWTKSNWAFLNEPPLTEMEGPANKYNKYAAQHHIAATANRGVNILGDPKAGMATDGVASTS